MSDIPCPLAEAAKRYGTEPALIAPDQVITYEQYDRLVASATANFRECGVTAGERVAIVAENGAEYAILLMALFRLRAVACPISLRFPKRAIFEYLQQIRCNRVIDPSNQLLTDRTQQIRKLSTDEILTLTDVGRLSKGTWSVFLGQDATIIPTSGTTAAPKAVLHSYGNHYHNALGSNKNIEVKPGDRWLLSLPLYHVGGLAILFRAMLGGGAVVIPDGRKNIADAVRRYRVTHLSLVPTQLHRLLREPSFTHHIKQLKAVLVGGSAVPKPLITQAHESGLPLFTTYGLTEMASQVTTTRPGDDVHRLFTSGRPLEHSQVKIDRSGEILVKGDTLCRGYVAGDSVSLPLDGEGWFHTGDLGSIDSDGYLTVTGRKDNMFISGGENIYPEEIEGTLSLLDGITEAVVVPVEDDEFGCRPVAFVRAADNMRLCKDELVEVLKGQLPRFKIPICFYRWPESREKPQIKPSRPYFLALLKKGELIEIT